MVFDQYNISSCGILARSDHGCKCEALYIHSMRQSFEHKRFLHKHGFTLTTGITIAEIKLIR